ncbi:MAG TPA: ATP-binding protein [Acholeplasmataceae bacterium]|nr:ATP-binding protein [Acholeplasmataceae bacterium]
MRYYILKITTRGIKNIEKDISLHFYPQTISKTLNIRKKNVKAIFGMNGSGKSAIIKSVELYRYLTTVKNYLTSTQKKYFDDLINKKTKSFYFNVIYAVYDEKNRNKIINIYSHSILVKYEDGFYKIIEERFSKLSKDSKTINGKYDLIFESKNGNLLTIEGYLGNYITNKTVNLLHDSSFFAIMKYYIKEFNGMLLEYQITPVETLYMKDLLYGGMMSLSLNIYLDIDDIYDAQSTYAYQFFEVFENLRDEKSNIDENIKINVNINVVKKENEKLYEDEIKNLERFIKIFKPNLKEITFIKKVNWDYFIYSLIFNYDGYSVDLELESTGIKKLVRLYPYLQYASKGEITFIDEMDANIHDVYLSKLIEFFEKYALGQLCFTSHNLGTMKELNYNDYSIDFINENIEIVSWKKNGNYSPYNRYRSGLIKGSPFNVNDFDYLSVFDVGEKDADNNRGRA